VLLGNAANGLDLIGGSLTPPVLSTDIVLSGVLIDAFSSFVAGSAIL
jgi:hypothetical protein